MAELIAVVMVLIVAFYGKGNTGNDRRSDGSLQKVLDAGQLVLGLDANFPPLSFTDSTGEIVGFDPDMFRVLCNRLGVRLVTRPVHWGHKQDALDEGTIDCIGSVSLQSPSARGMAMSEVYIKEDLVFMVPGNSRIMSVRDLKGKRIGVQNGASMQTAINRSVISKDVIFSVYDDNLEVLRQLKEGKLDAGLVDGTVAYYFMDASPERYFVLGDTLGEDELAIGFRKGDIDLRDKVQEVLSGMRFDGTLAVISKKWFGIDVTTIR
ncbi:MAG: transporter substrate-binding domain-containing protein [Fretibacterium sp.]|nr:transporter substrate-binding domain-containing protein [Fretibacterium sp.]